MEDLCRIAKMNGISVNGLSISKYQNCNQSTDNIIYLYNSSNYCNYSSNYSNININSGSSGSGSYQMNPTNLSLSDTQQYCS
jgi:hypothetical protein